MVWRATLRKYKILFFFSANYTQFFAKGRNTEHFAYPATTGVEDDSSRTLQFWDSSTQLPKGKNDTIAAEV